MGLVTTELGEGRIEFGIGYVNFEDRGFEREGVANGGFERKSQRDADQIRRTAADVRREGRGESGIATGSGGYQGDVQDADRSASEEAKLTKKFDDSRAKF